jgi:ribosomal protein S18 acetylase RimI-like enzyme
LLHSRRALFPVFGKNARVSSPHFLNRFLGKIHIHAVQGLREDSEQLEALMEGLGYSAAERIDYALMSLDRDPLPGAFRAGPDGLVLRSPLPGDAESLFALQSAYEQEEVLPVNAVFNPAACMMNLKNILASASVRVAELGGQVVAKINTSAESFSRHQIGGVYVRPDCRGRGIAERMAAVFTRSLLEKGKGVTLFVKKRNIAALKVYGKIGFDNLADYRISYY